MRKIISKCMMISGLFILLLSCNSTDFSNPEEVIKHYWELSYKNKDALIYDNFLSSKSKELLSQKEFIKERMVPDSIANIIEYLDLKISSYPIDINYPLYRRFKIEEKIRYKKDTLYNCYYRSLLNENGEWKVIWLVPFLSSAEDTYDTGNYVESQKILNKIVEIDPFCGDAHLLLACVYSKDEALSWREKEKKICDNAKHALLLEEENVKHYFKLAMLYSHLHNFDLTVYYAEQGLKYCIDEYSKNIFYSNFSKLFAVKQEYKEITNVYYTTKDNLMSDLLNLRVQYDDLQTNDDTLKAQLEVEKQKVDLMIEKLKKTDASNKAKIREYGRELISLREIMHSYIREIDLLNQ